MDRCKISEWEVVLGAPDRINIPCLMHDTRLCRVDIKMTMANTELIQILNTKPVMCKTGAHI